MIAAAWIGAMDKQGKGKKGEKGELLNAGKKKVGRP